MGDVDHLFGVEFYLGRDSNVRYCEIIANSSDDISEVLQKTYDDFAYISSIDDQGECSEDGELI